MGPIINCFPLLIITMLPQPGTQERDFGLNAAATAENLEQGEGGIISGVFLKTRHYSLRSNHEGCFVNIN